jgi:hypothetical protein
MANTVKMKALWAKKGVGDLVCMKEGFWPSTSKFSLVSKAGVIVAVVGDRFDVVVHARGTERKPCTRRITLAQGDVEAFLVEANNFPLLQLPLPVLSRAMAQFPHLGDAALLALVCKRFLAAFRDESAWKERCARELPGLQKVVDQSWYSTYREHGLWRIRVLTLGHQPLYMSNVPSDDKCCVYAFPETTVGDFLVLLRDAPYNRQKKTVPLFPFNPSNMKLQKGRIPHEWLVNWPHPNCTWKDDDPARTLREAGLCQDAVLARLDTVWGD